MIRHKIFGIKIDDISTNELTDLFLKWINESQAKTIFTPNPEFILKALKDKNFAQLLNISDLSLADGVGLKFAISMLTKGRLLNRQTGIDTLHLLAKCCADTEKRLVLIGGEKNSAQKTADVLIHQFPKLNVLTIEPGFISENSSKRIIEDLLKNKIRSLAPDVIAVALSFGKQERFIKEIISHIPGLKIAIGIGGAFDTISGRLPRAPFWMRNNGLEWLWRLCIEPKRIKRILRAVILFPIVVIWAKLNLKNNNYD
jgi:N-acetylglucosaminyldiphosphoundecaprenol N-acetyl-beta-D-mannosaminyltransferase